MCRSRTGGVCPYKKMSRGRPQWLCNYRGMRQVIFQRPLLLLNASVLAVHRSDSLVLLPGGQLEQTAAGTVFENIQSSCGALFDLADALAPFETFGLFGLVPG